ncbi:MAG: GFA family protein [Alphaproteobacteria bacterium]|nr:GFA family protein [Alphaproteobacteria bacterium]
MAARKKPATHSGGCHCGAVRFEVRAPDEIELVDCNCSICTKTGYLHLIVAKKDFKLVSGKDKLTEYKFNTGSAKHLFCSVCGIKSFYVPRSHPDGYSINFRCLDDQEAFASVMTRQFDGSAWEKNIDDLKPLESA